jgi:putative NADPH-quinone reductase
MGRRIAIIQGHPSKSGDHYCHAIADAYAEAARNAGHNLRRIEVAQLNFPVLRDAEEFKNGVPPEDIVKSQDAIGWAEHLVIVYPLWHGTMPALLKAYVEQVFRYGFAMDRRPNGMPVKLLKGRSARLIITMGMPAFIYRFYFWAHSLRSLERNILGISGISPIRASLIGSVEAMKASGHQKWLKRIAVLGRRGR